MSTGSDLINLIASRQNLADYQKKHWSGSFAEYLDIIRRDPKVTRTAYQRMYDMILSYGTEEVVVNKEKLVRYKFFEDPDNQGEDAIFGLERTLTSLVNILKSAANGYGTERRVLLLHGPVGSSKSTIVRLLKKGLERYSKADAGALYTFGWREEGLDGSETYADCPMHEDPLHLIPADPTLWELGNYEAFIEARKGMIAKKCDWLLRPEATATSLGPALSHIGASSFSTEGPASGR